MYGSVTKKKKEKSGKIDVEGRSICLSMSLDEDILITLG
jgi:hypothetical protein